MVVNVMMISILVWQLVKPNHLVVVLPGLDLLMEDGVMKWEPELNQKTVQLMNLLIKMETKVKFLSLKEIANKKNNKSLNPIVNGTKTSELIFLDVLKDVNVMMNSKKVLKLVKQKLLVVVLPGLLLPTEDGVMKWEPVLNQKKVLIIKLLTEMEITKKLPSKKG